MTTPHRSTAPASGRPAMAAVAWAPALLVGLTACGDTDPSVSDTRADDEVVSAYVASGEAASEGVQALVDLEFDPGLGGWRTEVLNIWGKAHLGGFVGLLADPNGVGDLADFLSPNYTGSTVLRPRDLDTVYRHGQLTVRMPEQGALAHAKRFSGARELDDLAAALVAPFGARRTAALHSKTKIFTVELDPKDDRRLSTKALVRLDGPIAGGDHEAPPAGLLQINMEWTVEWDTFGEGTDEYVMIRSITVDTYEEIQTGSALFAEVTESIVGGIPRFDTEFLLGAGDYHFRMDTLDGNVYAGQIGVALGDVNGDGLDDIFVPQHGGLPNRLLLHRADGTVEDVTEGSGIDILEMTQSALFLDLDNDGDQDIAMASSNLIVIGYNDGSGKFELRRPFSGGTDRIKSLVAADWDEDGDLDLYACIYSKKGPQGVKPIPYHDATNGPRNLAWRNDGDREWTDVTTELGFDDNNNKFSYAAVWEDFDGDGDQDLYVVNDFGRNNFFRNDDGHFSDVARAVGADDMAAGMGVSAADVDNDGDVDLYVTNMWSSAGRRIAPQAQFMDANGQARENFVRHARGNTLLLNDGTGQFVDVTVTSGAMNAGWAWGAMAIDLNNDSLVDFYSPNGFLTGEREDDI